MTTKIGDMVFVADTESVKGRRDCEDCAGTGTWQVKTALGEFVSPCASCCGSWDVVRGWLAYHTRKPRVWEGCVGRIEVTVSSKGEVHKYMLEETGVGSGRIWDEESIFIDYESAMVQAHVLTDKCRSDDVERAARDRAARMKRSLTYKDRDRLERILDHIDGEQSDKQKLIHIKQVARVALRR